MFMPEFGNWMIEANPSEPYNSICDAEILLSCEENLSYRRRVMEEFLKPYNLVPMTLANCMSLGTKNGLFIEDP